MYKPRIGTEPKRTGFEIMNLYSHNVKTVTQLKPLFKIIGTGIMRHTWQLSNLVYVM